MIHTAQYGCVWTIIFQIGSLVVWVVLLIESSSMTLSNVQEANTLVGFQAIIQKVEYLHCVEVSQNVVYSKLHIVSRSCS